ncbi:MAG: carbohydrate-binding domain-containing protein [Thermoleophilia bacterium]
MKKLTYYLAVILALGLLLAGCGSDASTATGSVTASQADRLTDTMTTATETVAAALSTYAKSHADADDGDYNESDVIDVDLSSATSQTNNGVTVEGTTITISAPGTYRLSGTLDGGQVLVDSPGEGKVRLILDDASITSSDSPALEIAAADELVLVLAAGSSNVLADAAGYSTSTSGDAPVAALSSMADLTIAGDGSLSVTGNANDGIASKDGLVILSGDVSVTAVDDGIRGKDYLRIEGGTVTVDAADDALKSDNEEDASVGYIAFLGGEVTLSAGDDGAHAEGGLVMGDATVTVLESTEGLEATAMTLAGGTIDVTASDDGINLAGGDGSDVGGFPGETSGNYNLTIAGGTITVDADGDGLDVNGAVTMTGGTVIVSGPTSDGNGALDADGGVTISGGILLAAGSAGMAVAPTSDSAQGWVSVTLDTPLAAGEVVQIVSGEDVLATYTTAKVTSSIVFSSASIVSGESYDVYVGGSASSDSLAGYSASGDLSGADKIASVTAGEHTAGGRGSGMGGGAPGA